MSLFFFKKIIREIFYTISFIVSLINLIFFLIKVDIKNKKVFLQPEGGFAHTVLTPEVLKRLYPKNEWLIVFGHDPKRHNKFIKDLYLNNFYWLDLSLNINKLSHIKDYYKNKVFLILEYYLKIKKIDYAYYVDFIQKYENFDKKKINQKFNKENLLMHEYNAYKIFSNCEIKSKDDLINENIKKLNLNFNQRKKCGFGYKKKNIHFYTNQRSTDDINNYKKSFFSLVENGYDIYLYGDEINNLPIWFGEIEKNIFHQKKLKISKNKFNFWSGLICDCFIGPSSGASSWKYIFHNKPQLIIDSYPIGWGFYNSVISFKIVIKHNFIKSVDELLDDQIYLLRKPPFQTRNTNEDEKNLIINNFIKSISNKTDEILDPKDLNLSKDHPLLWSNSLISKSWYNLQKNNL